MPNERCVELQAEWRAIRIDWLDHATPAQYLAWRDTLGCDALTDDQKMTADSRAC